MKKQLTISTEASAIKLFSLIYIPLSCRADCDGQISLIASA